MRLGLKLLVSDIVVSCSMRRAVVAAYWRKQHLHSHGAMSFEKQPYFLSRTQRHHKNAKMAY